MSVNVWAWILDSVKVHPEPVSIPDVSELTPVELAEIRSRLQTYAQVATELRKLVDVELAGKIPKALRYGDDVYRPSNGRGSAKLINEENWWSMISWALDKLAFTEKAALLSALYGPATPRLTALPKLTEVTGDSLEGVRETFIEYQPPSSPLSVMPIQKAPKYLQDLEEGEFR